MASNKVFRFGPIDLTTTLTTNLLNPPTATGGTNGGSSAQYIILRHIRIVNRGAAATFSLWLGLTGGNAAGTQVIGQGLSIAANSFADWYGVLRIDSADFLVGGSNTATALTITGEGEIGVSG